MTRMARTAQDRRNRFFEAEGVDELISMVLELTAEVSTLRQRLYVTERVLEAQGIAVSEGIEQYRPSGDEEQAMALERERLLQSVLHSLESPTRGDDGGPVEREETADETRAA